MATLARRAAEVLGPDADQVARPGGSRRAPRIVRRRRSSTGSECQAMAANERTP